MEAHNPLWVGSRDGRVMSAAPRSCMWQVSMHSSDGSVVYALLGEDIRPLIAEALRDAINFGSTLTVKLGADAHSDVIERLRQMANRYPASKQGAA